MDDIQIEIDELPTLDEVPPPPLLIRQNAVDANENDPIIIEQIVPSTTCMAGG